MKSLAASFGDYTDALLSCLCNAVSDVCFCGLVPGALTPMDYCDCTGDQCGMAFVRLNRAFPSDRLPVPNLSATKCQSALAVEFQVGVYRCVPTFGDAHGSAPSEADQNAAATRQYDDMIAVHDAIVCCGADAASAIVLGTYTPVGPAGGCGGGFWTVVVRP